MREINLIVVHCSATRADRDFTENDLEVCHRHRGFNGAGYHFYIRKNGGIKNTRPLEKPVYNTGVVPNYTTNGLIIARDNVKGGEILAYTKEYVGGVAVSLGNPSIRLQAHRAINKLLTWGNTNVNIHHIISDKVSVDEFYDTVVRYGDSIYYHVLLPLMPSGRSNKGIEPGVFEYLEEIIQKHDIKNAAFGAHFVEYLKTSKIKTHLYPPESLSKNVILTKDKVQITPSSFNLKPIRVINL